MNMARYAGRMAATGRYPGVSLLKPEIDFVSLARGYGVDAERVDDPGQLDAALVRAKAAIAAGRPYLVDALVQARFGSFDPDGYGHFSVPTRATT